MSFVADVVKSVAKPVLSLAGPILGLVGDAKAADAQTDAAQTAAASTDRASQITWDMYNQTRADLMPAIKSGNRARTQVESLLGKGFNYKQSPMFKTQVEQGQNALAKGYNAQGLLGSGAYPRANAAYVVGEAGKDYFNQAQLWLQTQINPRLSLANSGQVATTTSSQLGQEAASQAGLNTMSGANALAQGRVGSANAWTQGIQSAGNALAGGDWSGLKSLAATPATQAVVPATSYSAPVVKSPTINDWNAYSTPTWGGTATYPTW